MHSISNKNFMHFSSLINFSLVQLSSTIKCDLLNITGGLSEMTWVSSSLTRDSEFEPIPWEYSLNDDASIFLHKAKIQDFIDLFNKYQATNHLHKQTSVLWLFCVRKLITLLFFIFLLKIKVVGNIYHYDSYRVEEEIIALLM